MSKDKKASKKYFFWLIAGFAVALILRLVLLPYGNHNDLITNTGWSEWIYIHGPRGFYENKMWIYDSPTQLPLVNLIYYFNYIIFGKSLAVIALIREFFTTTNLFPQIAKVWVNFETLFGWTYYSTTPYMTGHVLAMKVIPVISDIAIGLVIYLIGSKFVTRRKAAFTALLYLFIPFSFYISSLWGQYDQLPALALLVSFYLIYLFGEGKSKFKYLFIPLSVICYVVAVEVKPTVIFTAPFFLYYVLRQKPKILDIIASALTGLGLYYVTTIPFTAGNVLNYTLNTIIPKVMFAGRNVLATQVFNFWEIVSPIRYSSTIYLILGIKAINWGYIFLILLNALAIFIVAKKNDIKTMLLGLFITAGGGIIFATGMLDRYYFVGLVIFLVLTMFYKKTLLLWLGAAVLFSINIFTSWGYPVNLQLHDIFWTNYPLVRLLSFVQVTIFIAAVVICLRYLKAFRSR